MKGLRQLVGVLEGSVLFSQHLRMGFPHHSFYWFDGQDYDISEFFKTWLGEGKVNNIILTKYIRGG